MINNSLGRSTRGVVADPGSEQPQKLVFALSEYQDAMVSRAAWPLIFRDTYGTSPFVIIGARLRDEPDIEKIVARRNPIQPAVSFYVSPSISDAIAQDLAAWNLVPIRATAAEFVDMWQELAQVDLDSEPSREIEIGRRFGSQFRELTTNHPGKVSVRHDFIGGDEPRWPDIVSSRYAQVDWIRSGRSTINRLGKDVKSASVLVYTGRRLSGRTTGLLALARAFREMAWRVFLYTAQERIDVDAVLQFASDGKALVLVLDGVADVAEDLQVILDRSRQAGLRIACLAVDHTDRSAGILGRLSATYLVDGSIKSINSRLTRTDAARLVDHLATAGRLGILEKRRDRERLRHFVGHGLFESLASVENAPGFGSRVQTLTAALTTSEELSLTLFVAVASRIDRVLTVVDAARVLEIDSEDVIRIVTYSPVSELVWTDRHRVAARHRWMALEPLVMRVGNRQALNILSAGLIRLSRRANRAAHRERNATTMFVGSMMIYRNLVDIFAVEDMNIWYSRLEGSFGSWSGRYWEQRAILNRRQGIQGNDDAALARAESFAERAITLVRDPYSYTTLGTILAARASVADRKDIESYYNRAFDAFESSTLLDPRNLVTWIAYLRHTLPILRRVAAEDAVDELEEKLFDEWLGIFNRTNAIASASSETKADLDRIRRQFDSIEQERGIDVPRDAIDGYEVDDSSSGDFL